MICSLSVSATLVAAVTAETDEPEELISCDEDAREDGGDEGGPSTGAEGGEAGGERLRRSRMTGGGCVAVAAMVLGLC